MLKDLAVWESLCNLVVSKEKRDMEKSYNDIQAQFSRIWHACVKRTTIYENMENETDEVIRFQQSDKQMQSRNTILCEKDKRLNDRIKRADAVVIRYLENLRKGSGFTEMTPYYATGERMSEYAEWIRKKFSRDKRLGLNEV